MNLISMLNGIRAWLQRLWMTIAGRNYRVASAEEMEHADLIVVAAWDRPRLMPLVTPGNVTLAHHLSLVRSHAPASRVLVETPIARALEENGFGLQGAVEIVGRMADPRDFIRDDREFARRVRVFCISRSPKRVLVIAHPMRMKKLISWMQMGLENAVAFAPASGKDLI